MENIKVKKRAKEGKGKSDQRRTLGDTFQKHRKGKLQKVAESRDNICFWVSV